MLFLSSGPHVPSARFRILPYLSHFRREGHHCVLANSYPEKYDYFPAMGFRPSQFLKRSVRRWHLLRARLSSFDVVFIDREIFDSEDDSMEKRFRDACGKLVLDIDDAVFLRYPEKFERLMRLSDTVVCGNRFLMDKVRPLNDKLLHIPTCVDLEDYQLVDRKPNPIPVVGWMGTTGNLKYIAVVAEALREASREFDFEFRVIVPDATPLKEFDLTGVKLRHEPWDPKNEVAQLQALDIGLMPLFADQQWDIYKCGLKLIQYLAVGVPGIAAPVGVNSEMIDENRNGFVAQETSEWVQALCALLSDEGRRSEMGRRGRKTVESKYSIQANYPVLRDGLERLIADG
ncbi:MAG: glycosyltransferase family 4 protein [Planctomycetota bacterium]